VEKKTRSLLISQSPKKSKRGNVGKEREIGKGERVRFSNS